MPQKQWIAICLVLVSALFAQYSFWNRITVSKRLPATDERSQDSLSWKDQLTGFETGDTPNNSRGSGISETVASSEKYIAVPVKLARKLIDKTDIFDNSLSASDLSGVLSLHPSEQTALNDILAEFNAKIIEWENNNARLSQFHDSDYLTIDPLPEDEGAALLSLLKERFTTNVEKDNAMLILEAIEKSAFWKAISVERFIWIENDNGSNRLIVAKPAEDSTGSYFLDTLASSNLIKSNGIGGFMSLGMRYDHLINNEAWKQYAFKLMPGTPDASPDETDGER